MYGTIINMQSCAKIPATALSAVFTPLTEKTAQSALNAPTPTAEHWKEREK